MHANVNVTEDRRDACESNPRLESLEWISSKPEVTLEAGKRDRYSQGTQLSSGLQNRTCPQLIIGSILKHKGLRFDNASVPFSRENRAPFEESLLACCRLGLCTKFWRVPSVRSVDQINHDDFHYPRRSLKSDAINFARNCSIIHGCRYSQVSVLLTLTFVKNRRSRRQNISLSKVGCIFPGGVCVSFHFCYFMKLRSSLLILSQYIY